MPTGMYHRAERVNNLIREELSKIIVKELEFPALVTLTEVSVSDNFEQAVIGFSVLCPYGTSPVSLRDISRREKGRPSDKSDEVLKILNRNLRHLQYLLMKKINIKPMPQIRFEIDYGLETAAKVEKLLLKDKIKEQ